MEKKKLSTGLLVLAYVMIAFWVGVGIYSLTITTGGEMVTTITDLIIAVFTFIYFFKGYTKNAAVYFKWAMIMTSVEFIVDYIGLAVAPSAAADLRNHYIELIMVLILYGNSMLLAFGKDFGKKASYILAGINCALYAFVLVTSITSSAAFSSVIVNVSWVVSSLIVLIMVKAKYIDKSNRMSE